MELNEAKTFLVNRAFISFPGVLQWINSASAKPAETIASWAAALDDVTIEECESALRWMSRTNERVEPFRFSADLRERAIQLRPKQNKALEEIRAGIAEAYERNQSSGAMARVERHSLWTDVWLPMLYAVQRGELTADKALAMFGDELESHFGRERFVV
jgi:hypothetical protein